MRTSLPFLAIAAGLLLAGCSGGDPSTNAADNGATPPNAAAHSSAATAGVGPADVEFAYRCRGLLSAASASSRILPAGETPPELARITMKAVAWWTGEAARRDDAAGIGADKRAELISGTTRVFVSRARLEEALPVIRDCLAQMPG
ncbi:hypothetical protein [Sphingomonas colocasiae]|uniref:Lipoprotein n=1 Tax=Sphingomonas colocasiae TaxID=1848973 RepID=A0ABS7PUX2_9SPHN|nr:hypothetical protein [Sphingomonas colocasiae]MBY8825161.1 hypothetical protein [Sphingomonas colocasiae]